MPPTTSAQFSLTLRVRIDDRPGMLGRVASAIGDAGGTIGDIELVETTRDHTLRDLTVDAGGKINADHLGHRGCEYHPANANYWGEGPGAGNGSCGAGYGGRGCFGGYGSAAGPTYGSATAPLGPGSGGAGYPPAEGLAFVKDVDITRCPHGADAHDVGVVVIGDVN